MRQLLLAAVQPFQHGPDLPGPELVDQPALRPVPVLLRPDGLSFDLKPFPAPGALGGKEPGGAEV